ncbi:MAG: NADP-dependent oxidoreductase [Arenimonas sp.]|jgi:NADPH:quinone reductase-like Zn-dependent oxidoreductase
MKAIVLGAFGSADNFFMAADLPIPAVRPGEVRVKVKAASFNPVDYQIRKGQPEGRFLRSMILGSDLSGSVDAVHEDVTDFVVGDEVFGYVCNRGSNGTYAEYVSVPAEFIARKPATLTHAQAAAVPVAAMTATLALDKVRARDDKSVFIAGGAGGVGTFAIAIAQWLGVRKLVTTAGNPKSRAHLIEQCQLRDDQIVDYRAADFVVEAMKRNRRGFDIALDLVGGEMLSACCALLAVDGNLASITEAPGQVDFDILFGKNASFHSIGANAYALTDDRKAWLKCRQMLDHLAWCFDHGVIAAPQITILGGLSTDVVKEAHALLEAHAVQGKLVMTC